MGSSMGGVRVRLTGTRRQVLLALRSGPKDQDVLGVGQDVLGPMCRLGWIQQAGRGEWEITASGVSVLEANKVPPAGGLPAGESRPELLVRILREGGQMPTKAYEGDAGWDMYAAEPVVIRAGEWRDVPSALAISVSPGYYTRITGRSSTWGRHGLLVIEGIIDSGFRGELFARVYNPTGQAVSIAPGDRVAQLLIHRVEPVHAVEVQDLPPSHRGANGFGSSGR